MSSPTANLRGLRRKAPQAELLRFAAQDGALMPGAACPAAASTRAARLACFERAAARRAFNRVLRQTVRVDPALARLYTVLTRTTR